MEHENRRAEIMEFQQKLLEFDITFTDLAKLRPKLVASTENVKEIAKIIATHPKLAAAFLEKKQLPMKELLSLVNSSRKTVNRHRKHIIALALIYLGEYPFLRTFI